MKLVGVAIVIVGFVLRVNPLLAVILAAVATGLGAGESLNAAVAELGRLFVDNRIATLPVVLALPVIGLLEYYGLREQAKTLVRKSGTKSAGRVILAYTTFRQVAISVGINIGGHAGMVRPLVAPMAEAAASLGHGELPPQVVEDIRAMAAAGENVGNFFGEDIFVAVGAVLLMKSFFDSQHLDVSLWGMALWGIPTALVAFGTMVWRTRRLDRRIARAMKPPPRA
jgi:uncharacterized membrane protein